MPKITSDQRTARRQQILDAGRRCFLRDGIAATTMQDILREGELSAGGVYLYFKSKEDIIEAIVLDTIAVLTEKFREIVSRPTMLPLDNAMGQVLSFLVAYDQEQPTFRIVIQLWALLQSTPHLLAKFTEVQQQWLAMFRTLVERYQAHGQVDPQIPAAHAAQVIVALIMGFITESVLIGPVDVDAFQAGFRALLHAQH